MKRYDIFCKIVDNFGDIGICWRLARQLASEQPAQVRLLIDDFAVASKIIHTLNINKITQYIDNIEILPINTLGITPADVVIETFACGLPDHYLQQLTQHQHVWINLDYLSAEAWVETFHAKPSPHPTLPITRHFYFPGFTANTGGLIREQHLLTERDAFQSSPTAQVQFWQNLNVQPIEGACKISLFCYAQADLTGLLNVLQLNEAPIQLFIPANSLITDFFNNIEQIPSHLNLVHLPFLSQTNYDKLLCACDLNFVRGEDSWIRAIWAAKPFIWQPYIQSENAHLVKLKAFIDLYYAGYEQKDMLFEAHQRWTSEQGFDSIGHTYLKNLAKIATLTQQATAQLATQTDLVAKLLAFANNQT